MPETFDPYYKWLGIPPKHQPPNHYRLLGLDLYESDADAIDAAASKHSAYLKDCAMGPHAALSQKLLNEISAARLCLLDPQRKSKYDEELQGQLAVPKAPPSASFAKPSRERAPSDRKTYRHCYGITTCPCGNDLTKPGSVFLGFVVMDMINQVPSSLRADGVLRDVNNVVGRGFHSYTKCARCGQDLGDYEDRDD
jgi:hypothetical protein